MTHQQDIFRHRLQFIQLLNQCLRIAVRRQFVRKSEAPFQSQRLGNDFGGLSRTPKRAGKDQVEIQVQIPHGSGNLPELAFAFGREGPPGICFDPLGAAFHRHSMS